MSLIFHPILALIASVTDRELARYVEFLKEENKILRSRMPGQIHTKPHERDRLLKLGNNGRWRRVTFLEGCVRNGSFQVHQLTSGDDSLKQQELKTNCILSLI